MGSEGASCYHTLSKETRDIPKTAWDEERVGMLCTHSEDFAALISALEKLCLKNNRCSYQETELIHEMKLKMESLR